MPSADQVVHMQQVLDAYKTQVQGIVTKHKTAVKQAVDEADRRKTQRLLKKLGKI